MSTLVVTHLGGYVRLSDEILRVLPGRLRLVNKPVSLPEVLFPLRRAGELRFDGRDYRRGRRCA